ncbi:MAG TPA: FAD-binding oxidoreductase [Candidatus Marinimicrobia bacterium]|nr:FAD-binding oxidoreductase [Candidatus Neomarinimicrobiota bacterium]HIO36880.1 FAD-binding oxidoreductase [Candidatus Neomarinimicrobiota bacterium]HIO88864.1 FAD-binding oxidoreductase [Candidatus Neomarinimicrobiota bacterium]
MNTTPFWTDQYPRPDDIPVSSDLPSEVDMAVVGSGYTGLNTARVLAESGASVAVIERNTVGWGASSRNGGMPHRVLNRVCPRFTRNTVLKKGGSSGKRLWMPLTFLKISLMSTVSIVTGPGWAMWLLPPTSPTSVN